MATLRHDEPEQAPRAAVTVPPELAVGPLAEVWANGPHDLGTAYMRHGRARRAWERSEHVDIAAACALVPAAGPWSLASSPERLARLGFTPDDLPRLRRAAEARTRTTEPSRRTT